MTNWPCSCPPPRCAPCSHVMRKWAVRPSGEASSTRVTLDADRCDEDFEWDDDEAMYAHLVAQATKARLKRCRPSHEAARDTEALRQNDTGEGLPPTATQHFWMTGGGRNANALTGGTPFSGHSTCDCGTPYASALAQFCATCGIVREEGRRGMPCPQGDTANRAEDATREAPS